MPQMLASQNKPECESQEHFEWCQLSACQSDISLPPVCPSLCVAWTRPRTHPRECSSVFLPPVWMLPPQIQRVLMNADVFVSFFWRSCAAMERRTTAHVTPFTRRWDRSKAEKKPRDEEVLPGSGARQVHSHVLRRKKREDSECTTHEQRHAAVAEQIYRHIKWHVVGHRLLTFTGIWLLWTASQPGRTPVWCLWTNTDFIWSTKNEWTIQTCGGSHGKGRITDARSKGGHSLWPAYIHTQPTQSFTPAHVDRFSCGRCRHGEKSPATFFTCTRKYGSFHPYTLYCTHFLFLLAAFSLSSFSRFSPPFSFSLTSFVSFSSSSSPFR